MAETASDATRDAGRLPIYAALAGVWLCLAIAMPLRRLSLAPDDCFVLIAAAGWVIGFAISLRRRGLVAVATAIEAAVLLSTASMTFTLVSFTVATARAPLADGAMASLDALLLPGVDWPTTVISFCRHPALLRVANLCYASIAWQGAVLILVCCASGRRERCWSFILAWTLTLAIVVSVFAWLPCLGAYRHFGIPESAVAGVGSHVGWVQPRLLALFRSGGPVRIDTGLLAGIVQFPSFHVASAILFAWGAWERRPIRWPAILLNLGMIVSTVPIGGHYFIDLPGGVAAAVLGIGLARRLEARSALSRSTAHAGRRSSPALATA